MQLAGAGELRGVRVVQGHIPPRPGRLLAFGEALGGFVGGGGGDGLLHQPPRRPRAEPVSDSGVDGTRLSQRQRVGALGEPPSPPSRNPKSSYVRPGGREAVDQVQGVGQQRLPGVRGDPEDGGELFAGERGHRRGAVPTQGLRRSQTGRQQGGAAPGGDVLEGGVEDGPLVGQHQLVACRDAFAVVGLGQGGQDRGGVEVTHRVEVQPVVVHESCLSAATDIPTPEPGVLHRTRGHEQVTISSSPPGVVSRRSLRSLLNHRRRARSQATDGRLAPRALAASWWCGSRLESLTPYPRGDSSA